MWAVFIFIMGIIGIVLINIFGNITTTNQQDYTLLRNTVEAAMEDAIDKASYRGGFYLCMKSEIPKNSAGQLQFKSKSEYDIVLNHNVNKTQLEKNYYKCDFLVGEIKINKDVFVESFLRRFTNNINNNKSYEVTIQDVIEYPPKVSVRVDTYDTYNSQESRTYDFYEGDFNIRNQIDSILEEKS